MPQGLLSTWGRPHAQAQAQAPGEKETSPAPRDTCLAHVRLFGPGAAGLCTGSFCWAVGAGPTAHLNAAFLLLGLFAWAGAVLIPSPFRKRGVQNLGAEEGAGAVELAEVTQRDDGIHGALETARGLGAGGDTVSASAFTAQNLPATPEHRAWQGSSTGFPASRGRPASQAA